MTVDVAELKDLHWDIPADQDRAHQFMVERGLERDYLKFRERVWKLGAFAALMEIWERIEWWAEFTTWCALAARAERELAERAGSN